MRIRVKLKRSAEGLWFVDLPTFAMVPGSVEPVIDELTTPDGVLAVADQTDSRLQRLSCMVEVPDDYIDERTGKPSRVTLRLLHRGHPRWGLGNSTDPDIDLQL